MTNFEEEGLGEGELGLPPGSQETPPEAEPTGGDLPLSETLETGATPESKNDNPVEGLESEKEIEPESKKEGESDKFEEELDAIAQDILRDLYSDERTVEADLESSKKDKEKIEEIEQELGMDSKMHQEIVDSDEESLKKARERLASAEKRYLEIPKGPAEGEENHQSLDAAGELEQAFEDKKAELAEMEKTAEAEAKKMREEFVEKFIKDSIKRVFERMDEDPEMSDIVNMKKGKKLATLKITSAVHDFAERFIEEGGFPDFGYRITWSYCFYDTGKGEGQKKYITEINLERSYRAEAGG